MIQHLACVMDGNRRWATAQGLQTFLGHRKGADTVKIIAEFCLDNKIPHLSLYTLSIENLNRSEQEKSYIYSLVQEYARDNIKELIERGIRIRFIGDRTLFPAHIMPICDMLEQQTAHLTTLCINVLFCYGGRQEIVSGVKKIVQALANGALSVQEVDALSVDAFKKYTWMGDTPDPDIIIRPGNVVRLSNFLLYQGAYSEWYFPNFLWPELTKDYLTHVLADFAGRKRNFGR
jgi:undecaprenyl diphosphate synthase